MEYCNLKNDPNEHVLTDFYVRLALFAECNS